MIRIVTLARLNRALGTAIDDFTVCGLYIDELHAVPVQLTWTGLAYGHCWDDGVIDIPAIAASEPTGRVRSTPTLD